MHGRIIKQSKIMMIHGVETREERDKEKGKVKERTNTATILTSCSNF